MKKENNIEIIYMDQASYDRFLEELDALEKQKNDINRGRGLLKRRVKSTEWDDEELLEIDRKVAVINDNINMRKKMLARIVITNKIEDESLVDFGDILELKITDADGVDNLVVKLVGDASHYDPKKGYLEMSGNSRIGKLIYGEQVGKKIKYKDQLGITCSVEILQKINVDTNTKEDTKTKKLVKQPKK